MELHGEVSADEEVEGCVWKCCAKRPITALVLTFALVIGFWTPFYFATPILPIQLETDFEAYLTSDEPAFVEYNQFKEMLEDLGEMAIELADKDVGEVVAQRAPNQVAEADAISRDNIELLYLCSVENCETIYTKEALTAIRDFERLFRERFYKPGMCMPKFDDPDACELPNSITNFFFPSKVPGTSSSRLDGGGENIVEIEPTLKLIKQQGEMSSWFFSKEAFEDGKTIVTRSSFRFSTKGDTFMQLAKGELLTFLIENQQLDGVRVLWYNTKLNEAEIERIVFEDLRFALGSVIVVFGVMWLHSESFFLTTIAVLSILLCYPATYVIYRLFAGIEVMMIFNFSSVFVLVGIGADDFFIFSDLWVQSRQIPNFSYAQRLGWTFRHAGGATLVTTFTTASSFFANLSSPIQPIRAFGTFMGIIVITLYVHIILFLPPALVIFDKYFLSMCKCGSLPTLSVPQPVSSWAAKRKAALKDWRANSPNSGMNLPVAVSASEQVRGEAVEAQTNILPAEQTNLGNQQHSEESKTPGLGRLGMLRKTSSAKVVELFGSVSSIPLEMEDDTREVSSQSPVVLFFYNKLGPFIFRFRYVLVVVILSLFLAIVVPLKNQARPADSIPDIFSTDNNMGMVMSMRRSNFKGEIKLPEPGTIPDAVICDTETGSQTFCTLAPSKSPTTAPTKFPTKTPSVSPTRAPTLSPIPTPVPTQQPTRPPTFPTVPPTQAPTILVTNSPTRPPTPPTAFPTTPPTPPTPVPTRAPSNAPTAFPTESPTPPTPVPTRAPSDAPTLFPTQSPTLSPSRAPVSNLILMVQVLGGGKPIPISTPFKPDALSYEVFSGKYPGSSLEFLVSPASQNAQVVVDVLSDDFVQIFVSNPTEGDILRYNFTIMYVVPPECNCNDNGQCDPRATKEDPFCICFEGYSGSDCSEVDQAITGLGDNEVNRVRIAWQRSAGFSSFVDLQETIVNLCDRLDNFTSAKGGNPLQVRRVENCWLRDEVRRRQGQFFNEFVVRYPLNVTEQQFSLFLQRLVRRQKRDNRDIVLFNEKGEIEAISIMVITNLDKLAGMEEADAAYRVWEKFIKEEDPRLLQTSFLWARTQTEKAIVDGTLMSAIVSVLCAFVAIYVFTKFNLLVTMVTTFSIVVVILFLLGTIVVFLERPIGAIESLSCIVLIGLAVDYSVHLAHTFDNSRCATLEARARHALGQTGVSILFGALTTGGAATLLLFSNIVLFRDFGTFVLFNALYSLFVSIFFLIPALVLAYSAWHFVRARLEVWFGPCVETIKQRVSDVVAPLAAKVSESLHSCLENIKERFRRRARSETLMSY